jgi:hypothetical protein
MMLKRSYGKGHESEGHLSVGYQLACPQNPRAHDRITGPGVDALGFDRKLIAREHE